MLYFDQGRGAGGRVHVPFGVADVKREGTDVTVVGIHTMVHEALEAAEKLADEGISVEVIDPRTLSPLDIDTIVASVKKTEPADRRPRGRTSAAASAARSPCRSWSAPSTTWTRRS